MINNKMEEQNVFSLVMSMGLPPMISMLIQSLYNIVDSMYVAKLGENALTAVSLAYPMQNIVLAVSVGFGVGMNSVISRALGSQNNNEVNSACCYGFLLSGIHAIIFVLIGLFLTEPFFKLYTTNSEIYSLGITYCRIVVCMAVGQLFHIYIEKLFQAIGNVTIPMIMQLVASLINIILDPILIFGYFGFPTLGVQGAAIATVIAQMSACILSFVLFIKFKGNIQISFKYFHFDRKLVKNIYVVAIPSSLMSAMPSLLVSVLNGILASISSTAVAVFGLYYKVQTFVYMPANGIIQGMRPIIGYNYGARKYQRVHDTIKTCILVIGCMMIIGTAIFLLIPDMILSLFSATDEIYNIGIPAFRIISLGFIISTIGVVFSGVFEALGKGIQSLTITILRQMSIIPILSLIFKNIFGLYGIWITFVIAESIASMAAITLYKKINI